MASSLLGQVALVAAIVLAVNLPASLLGIDFAEEGASPIAWAPPGWVIPVAWTLLFAALAVARGRLLQAGAPDIARGTLGLVVLCATYAWTTLGLARLTGWSPLVLGMLVNLLVIVSSAWLALAATSRDSIAPWLLWPVTAWTLYATLLISAELRLVAT